MTDTIAPSTRIAPAPAAQDDKSTSHGLEIRHCIGISTGPGPSFASHSSKTATASARRRWSVRSERASGEGDLVVDERVVEPGAGGVVPGVGVDEAVDARPVGGRQAHRAGLAAAVQHAALEAKRGQLPAGAADRDDLGVGRRGPGPT